MLTIFERAVNDLMVAFDVTRPPVPVELMLQRPRPGMWKEVNLSELSLSFISVNQRYSPRMSVARLLARHICRCEWGATRGLGAYAENDEATRSLARAIIMPRQMLEEGGAASRLVPILSDKFEMPEEDVERRLRELDL